MPIVVMMLLAGCQKKEAAAGRLTVLIGATTIVAPGAKPIEDSIVVIAGSKIRSVGMRKDVPVPQASDRIDLTGAWIVPAKGARIDAGDTANLIILRHAPNGDEPASPADITSRIVAGDLQLPK